MLRGELVEHLVLGAFELGDHRDELGAVTIHGVGVALRLAVVVLGQRGLRHESPQPGVVSLVGEMGELLYTSMTVDGHSRSFYRFRTPDGIVDYYDEQGNSAKKFLMRNPVKGGRYTSGFGTRRHPLLGITRMHTGVDWAAPTGTPILAGADGTVERVGRQGGYGNYIRIRHANGFATAYGHMSRYADGVQPGTSVKQGQVIGYVGSTGYSTGPHCHYEILVNNKFVNPMTIQVPRGLQLTGVLAQLRRDELVAEEVV